MIKLVNILQEIQIRHIPLIKGKAYILFPESNKIIAIYKGKNDEGFHIFREHDPKHKNDPTYDETYGVNYSGKDDVISQMMLKDKTIIPYNG